MWSESRRVLTPFAHAFDFGVVFELDAEAKSKAPPGNSSSDSNSSLAATGPPEIAAT
jgi:hypothetical protein